MGPKLVVIAVALTLSAACATSNIGGQRRRVLMPQVGVVVTIVNNCAPILEVERESTVEAQVPYSKSATVPMASEAFGGYNRTIEVTVKAYNAMMHYLGSLTERFYVSIYEGTRRQTIVVDRLESPPGAKCAPPP